MPRPALLSDPLQPYIPSADKPWDAHRVMHLYRRLGFGAALPQIEQGLLMSPEALVDQLLDTAAALPAPQPPYWANYTRTDYNYDLNLINQHFQELRRRWVREMIDEGVRSRMALFWHNHFVTEQTVYYWNAYAWNYYDLLHRHAFGNFRDFVLAIAKCPAMLVYLNGNQSVAGNPNENYARELMELFTMGESNGYTQMDIVEMSRALTGWELAQGYQNIPVFNPALHDETPKTIFGVTGNFGFDEAHQIIFTERAQQVSEFICRKLYKHFVYEHPDPEVIEGLAATFRANGWDILPVVRQLLKSEHFFEDRHINVRIKMPFEIMTHLYKMANGQTDIQDTWLDMAHNFWAFLLGQDIFTPPNVAGWPGYRAWINENTMTFRWQFASSTVFNISYTQTMREHLRTLALTLSNGSNDPVVIVSALTAFLFNMKIEPVHLEGAVIAFKTNIPQNYFDDGSWNLYWDEAPTQVAQMLYYVVKIPEFQLT